VRATEPVSHKAPSGVSDSTAAESAAAVRERVRLAVEAAPNAMLLADAAGRVLLVNARLEWMFGYRPEEVVGQPVEFLVPPRLRGAHAAHRIGYQRTAAERAMGPANEVLGLHKNGEELPIEIGLYPILTSQGMWTLASIIDNSGRKRAEAALAFAIAQRDMLLREAHHRVKNSLQIIVSMLSLQSMSSADPVLQRSLRECSDRIQALALVHEKLCRADDRGRVDFADYIGSLARHLLESCGISPARVHIELRVKDVHLGMETAMSCGMILSEVLTCKLMHAFADGASGTLCVSLERSETGRWRLCVSDDRVAAASQAVGAGPQSLSLQIIRALAEQMDGVLDMDLTGGKVFNLEFSERTYSGRL
jgi:PAS domain S-box-containing protein